jgi:hypothetical protein
MRHWLALLALTLHAVLPFNRTAQTSVDVSFVNSAPDIVFSSKVSFKVQITASNPVQKVFIYIEPQGRPAAFYPMVLADDGSASYAIDLVQTPLRVFSTITYHYRVSMDGVDDINSQDFTFEYRDKRFDWKSLKTDAFEVSWYDRDVDFGQLALNTAIAGLESAQQVLPVQVKAQIRIFIYSSASDLQGTRLGMLSWVAGHTTPDMRLILVSIPPGPSQKLELERQIPHELTHILQYEAYGDRTKNFPVWLIEGTASVAELYPNPEYANVLQTSVKQEQLIPMELLCLEFPRDASGAFLAYAQSQSFVRFISQKFGASGMQLLYNQYRDGLGCKEGVQTAFGTALPELEYQWRLKSLGVNPAALVVQNLIPYLFFLLLILGAASVTILFYSNRRKAAGIS